MASVVPPEKLHAAARGARGIIGQDLLMTLNYTLDYKRRRFALSLPEAGNASTVELLLEIEEGRVLLLALPSQAGQPPVREVRLKHADAARSNGGDRTALQRRPAHTSTRCCL